MNHERIVDLCCKAGGASEGYHRAFPDAEIVGVDIEPQPNYPFEFVQADAMTFDLAGFTIVHASPPCHDWSTVTGKARGSHGTAWMLHAMIERLTALDIPWVVENVEGATMPATVFSFTLCGSSFGLDVRRHRKFATNTLMFPPSCDHAWQTPRFQSKRNDMRKRGQLSPVVGVHGDSNYCGDFEDRCKAMGIGWMTLQELNQAIPPAYTEYIGNQLAEQLERAS